MGKLLMFKIRLLVLLAILTGVSLTLRAEVDNNIVITSCDEEYTFVPDASGTKIEIIKQATRKRFEATRVPGVAVDYIFYNDFVKVKKAKVKAKGVKPDYRSSSSAGIFYDDSKICTLPVSLEEVNKAVETQFETEIIRPDMGISTFLGSFYPIREGKLTFVIPAQFKDKLKIKADNLLDDASINETLSDKGDTYYYTITYSSPKPMKLPDDAPSAYRVLPVVQVLGMFDDVQDLYHGFISKFDNANPGIEEVENFTRQLVAQCDSDKDKVETIVKWVRENIRYIAVEHGDLGHIPDLAGEVLRKRYGDCKGSANLIKWMLKSVGLDGRLVWIGTDKIPYNWTERPSYSTGNHMIAAWIMPDDSIAYYDGTIGYADLDYLSPSIQGKQTLIEDNDRCIIDRVPVLPAYSNRRVVSYDLKVEDNTLVGTVVDSVAGIMKSGLLNGYYATPNTKRNEFFTNYLSENRASYILSNISADNLQSSHGPASICSDIKIERAIKKVGNKIYLTLDLYPTFNTRLFDMDNRSCGGRISSMKYDKRTARILLAAGQKTTSVPDNVTIENDWIKAIIEYNVDTIDHDNVALNIFTEVEVKNRDVPFEHLEKYNNDIKAFIKAVKRSFIIENSEN